MIFLPRISVLAVARVAVVLAVALLILLSIQDCRIADRDAKIAVATAERMGWTADSGRPKIPDLPPGSRPVAVVTGAVRYLPVRRPVVAAPGPGIPVPPVPTGGGCDLDALTVDMDCRMEIASASGVGVAKLWVHGELADGARRRVLPWARVGEPVTIRLPGGLEQPVETEAPIVRAVPLPPPDRVALGLRRPSAWRAGWVAGLGVSADVYGRTAPAAFVGYGIQF